MIIAKVGGSGGMSGISTDFIGPRRGASGALEMGVATPSSGFLGSLF